MNLSTNYLGLELKNPIIAGASSLTSNIDVIQKLEEAGVAAIIVKSLFEEEIQLQRFLMEEDNEKYSNMNAEMVTVFPEMKHAGPKEHLYWLKKTVEAVDIPVIGSLNAVNKETWVDWAEQMEATGIAAIELNFFASPKNVDITPEEIENEQLEIMQEIKAKLKIPVSVKLSPTYTNIQNFIMKIDKLGIDGIVMFNRLFQPDINIYTEKNMFPYNFSNQKDNRQPLRYVGLLSEKIDASICANTGILESDDVVKMILAGADAVQMVSALYLYGNKQIENILDNIKAWMELKGYDTLNDFKFKMNKKNTVDPWVYTRAQYVKLMMNPKTIIENNKM